MTSTSCDRIRFMGLQAPMLNQFIRPDEVFSFSGVDSWLIVGGPENGQVITYNEAVAIQNGYSDSCTPPITCLPLFSSEFSNLFECVGGPSPEGGTYSPQFQPAFN